MALKFLKNFKILKKLSLKNAIFKHFWGFFACFYAILAFRDNRVSPASNHDSSLCELFFYCLNYRTRNDSPLGCLRKTRLRLYGELLS